MHKNDIREAESIISMEEYLKKRQALRETQRDIRGGYHTESADALRIAEILYI